MNTNKFLIALVAMSIIACSIFIRAAFAQTYTPIAPLLPPGVSAPMTYGANVPDTSQIDPLANVPQSYGPQIYNPKAPQPIAPIPQTPIGQSIGQSETNYTTIGNQITAKQNSGPSAFGQSITNKIAETGDGTVEIKTSDTTHLVTPNARTTACTQYGESTYCH